RILLRIATTSNEGGWWIYENGTGRLTRLTGDTSIGAADWTRDGRNVVYVDGARTNSERLVMRAWDGGGDPIALTPTQTMYGYSGLSIGPPNGISAFRRGSSATAAIWVAPTDHLTEERALITGEGSRLSPHVSPTGRLLAYTSDEWGKYEVYITPLPGPGPHVLVSVGGGTEPQWSADGQVLFYRGQTRMMMARIAESPLAVSRLDTLFADTYSRGSYDVFPSGREL